jgi:hypothetical protein
MEINTRNEINGQMCYVCKKTFVQFRRIRYYLDFWGDIVQDKPRVICMECNKKKNLKEMRLRYQWLGFKWGM